MGTRSLDRPLYNKISRASRIGERTVVAGTPAMLVLGRDRVWFTDWSNGLLGKLAPAIDVGQSSQVLPAMATLTPQCDSIGPGSPTAVKIKANQLAEWIATPFTTTLDQDGWALYQLPGLSNPWGVAVVTGTAWVAQQWTQKLGRLSFEPCYYLTTSRRGHGGDPVADPPHSAACGPEQYVAGERINLTAQPYPGFDIRGWSGTDDDALTTVQNTITMPATDHTVLVLYPPSTFLPAFLPVIMKR